MPQHSPIHSVQRLVRVSTPTAVLEGHLAVPIRARGLVILAHGSSDPIYGAANDLAAASLSDAGYATLTVALLGPAELIEDAETSSLRFNLRLLSTRLLGTVAWSSHHPVLSKLGVAVLAGGTCAASALVAAAHDHRGRIETVVSRGGRPELAGSSLTRIKVPTLLLVGELDSANLATNQRALDQLPAGSRIQVIEGARLSLEENDALLRATELCAAWVERVFATAGPRTHELLHLAV
jgi:putative phosphoribosyl transferase